jgi:ribonucleoside-triphosphate reductase
MTTEATGKQLLSDSRFYMGYSRWDEDTQRYESWEDSVHRVMQMHRQKYADKMTPELEGYIAEAEQAYLDKQILGAQRALQFGGEQLFKHEARMYNCATSHVDRPAFFNEAMYLLLCGCGVGFSVQDRHLKKLPKLGKRSLRKSVKVFKIPDSIEGWADSFAVLLSSFIDGGVFPEYKGHIVHFDYSEIRPKGAMISGGFKAPGPDGLRAALIKCEQLLETFVGDSNEKALDSITAYDFVMHMSDAVLSGGVRRSATICLFDKNDDKMLKAKTGNWFIDNPQRARSNNSAVIVRGEITREEWAKIMQSVKQYGEPGFIFTDDPDHTYNPCVEIGMKPLTISGEGGWQFCNLVEQNGSKITSKEKLMYSVRTAAIMATLQVGYTNFKYLSPASKEITEREALIGVSITGWMNNPQILFNPEYLREAAEEVKRVNKLVAKLIGVNPAARTTCGKPAGNSSAILMTGSGIHGEHDRRYFRNMQMNKQDEVTKLLLEKNPQLFEESVWSSSGTDYVVSFPLEVLEGNALFKEDLLGIKQLEYVKIAQQNWVEYGTDEELCVDKKLRHNISNTVQVDNWDEVEQYLFDNKEWFAGVSLLSSSGDKDYPQAPFTSVLTAEQLLSTYGVASMFASGLIVDALQAFNDNLWLACDEALKETTFTGTSAALRADWKRRFLKFANSYFNNDLKMTAYCLKDCYNLHKWEVITRQMKPVNFKEELSQPKYVEVDTMGAQACAGGACEISF